MKRGIFGFGFLALGIIVLAALIGLIFFIAETAYNTNEFAEDSECKSSITMHTTLLKTSGESAVSDIYCPTRYYTSKARNENEAKRDLAEAMRTCWGTWDRGELQLFKDDAIYCHICSVVSFDNKKIKFNDFKNYLATTTIPVRNDAVTYADYLNFYSTTNPNLKDKESLLENKEINFQVDTSKRYATMFIYAKGDNYWKELLESMSPANTQSSTGGGALAGAAAGGAIGSVVVFGGGVALGVIGIASGPPGWIILAGAIAGGGYGAWNGWMLGNNVEHIAIPMLIEYQPAEISRFGCKVTPTKQDQEKDRLG